MVSEPTDLDELDRLRAAASYADKWEYISDFVSVACWMYCHGGSPTMEPADKAWLFTLIEAYPALAGELRELREKVECQRDLVECALAYIQANQRETPDEEEIGDCYTHLYFAAIDMATKQAEPIMQTRGPKP